MNINIFNYICIYLIACNPRTGQYDHSVDIASNTGLHTPLLSRFDIILLLLDQPEKEWDVSVSTFLLKVKDEFVIVIYFYIIFYILQYHSSSSFPIIFLLVD